MTDSAAQSGYTGPMKVIYADSLFALSLVTDYLLCLAAAAMIAVGVASMSAQGQKTTNTVTDL